MWPALQEALDFKALHRLGHRDQAHMELLGEPATRENRTHPQISGQYLVQDSMIGLVRQTGPGFPVLASRWTFGHRI